MTFARFLLMGLAVIAAGTVSNNVHGQVEEPEQRTIEEIVVTAQKRAESIQDVPISISALSGEFLQDVGAEQVTDILIYVPGVTGNTQGAATPVWAIRGISTNDFTTGSEPSVGTFQDDAYVGRNSYATSAFFDIDRVEVLRGPQGTLFGRNAVAGAINVITKRPGDANTATLAGSFGDEGQRVYDFAGDLKPSDTLAFRLAYHRNEYDGIVKNLASGRDQFWEDNGLRLTASWDVNSSVTAEVMAQRYEVETDANKLHYPDIATVGFGDPYSKEILHETLETETNETNGFDLRLSWEISDSLSLTSISDARDFDFSFSQDLDADADIGFGGSVGYLQPEVKGKTLAQELRLNGISDNSEWLIGASWFDEDTDERQFLTVADFPLDGAITHGETTSTAIYGDVVWHATDRFGITVGGRYTQDKKDWCAVNIDLTGLALSGPDTGGIPVCGSRDWSEFTPRLVADYSIGENSLLYASFSRGYKAGGFNTSVDGVVDPVSGFLLPTGDLLSFDPEKLTTYELGFKLTLASSALQLNGAAYFNDYKNLQVQVLKQAQIAIDNAATAETKGLELEVVYLPPIDGLTFSASYAYNDAKYTDGAIEGVSISGNRLIQAPENSFVVSAKYEMPLSRLGQLSLFGGYTWQDEQYFDAFNTAYLHNDSYGLLDARVAFEHGSGRWGIELTTKNLLDENYPTQLSDPLGIGVRGIVRGTPRFVRLGFNLYFGD